MKIFQIILFLGLFLLNNVLFAMHNEIDDDDFPVHTQQLRHLDDISQVGKNILSFTSYIKDSLFEVSKNFLPRRDSIQNSPRRSCIDSLLPMGKQMNAGNLITTQDWRVSLAFTRISSKKFLIWDINTNHHPVVVFEGLNEDGSYIFFKTHWINEEAHHKYVTNEEEAKNIWENEINRKIELKEVKEELFKWTVNKNDVVKVINKIELKKVNANNCVYYALTVLKECGIPLPKFTPSWGSIPPWEVPKALNQAYEKK